MRLLDRYLLRELVTPLFYCLVGFQIFWTAFDLFSRLDVYQNANMTAGEIAHYYLLQTPELLTTVLPIALLLALLYALTNHARHNELVAMRAAGVSVKRLSAPYFAVAAILGGGLFAITEFVVPKASAEASRLVSANEETKTEWLENIDFMDGIRNQIWNIKRFNPTTGEMEQPSVGWEEADASYWLSATNAVWKQNMWVFYGVALQTYQPPTERIPTTKLSTNVLAGPFIGGTPEQLRIEIKIGRMEDMLAAKRLQLSIGELLEYQKLNRHMSDKRRAKVMTQLHGRIAQPFTCLVVVWVALPFGMAGGRRNAYAGVAVSVAIFFFYFILLRLGLAFGIGGYIPPVLAGWLPNLIFACAGSLMLRRMP